MALFPPFPSIVLSLIPGIPLIIIETVAVKTTAVAPPILASAVTTILRWDARTMCAQVI
jgi:hypothetical protein